MKKTLVSSGPDRPSIYLTSAGTYWCRLRFGKDEYIKIKGSTEQEVLDAIKKYQKQHKAGTSFAKAANHGLSLSQAIDKYVAENSERLAPSTIRGYDVIKRNRFKSIMNVPLRSIDNWQKVLNDEMQLLNPKTKLPYSKKTIKNAWGLVATVLDYNDIERPKRGKVKLPQVVSQERPCMDPKEIPVFINAIRGKTHEAAALLALHGLRASEIRALHVPDNIDLKHGVIHIHASSARGKNGYVRKDTSKTPTGNRDVPIMIPRLKEILPESGAVDPVNNYINEWLHKICQEAGITDVSMHCLRHTFCTLCFDQGLDLKTIQRLGGWKDINTVMTVYNHWLESKQTEGVDKLTKFFAADTI